MNSLLITGGTGSIGNAIVGKILNSKNPIFDRIVIYSRDEHKQEKMAERFKNHSGSLRFFIGDVRDKERLRIAMSGCICIIHAAALKIVPAGEYNPIEFVKTNVLGAQNIIEILASDSTRLYTKVLALSTDKAVNPINLYGATKLCMEKLFLATNNLVGDRDIKFSICRYGNVANSNGSVIQKFKRQIDAGEKITITDTRMTRYWITLEEAADFILDSLLKMGKQEIFIPSMPSFNIMDLARALHNGDIEFNYDIIGIRPGEKIHEQIDVDRFSNINDNWIYWADLKERLNKIGVL